MCPWVGPHAPSFERQLWGLPSRMEYLSPKGVLLPPVYGMTASLLWLELCGLSAWQATPSWTVYQLASHPLLPWLRVTFAMVPDATWPGSDQRPCGTAPAARPVGRLGRPRALDPWNFGSFPSLGCPTCACVCSVLGDLAPVHQCARSVRCVACAVSWATWLLFTGVHARCVALRVRCPGPLGSFSPMCPLGVLCRVFGVQGHLAPVHRSARSVRCVACEVSWATWLLFTGVPARCVVLRVPCPGPLGSCSVVCAHGVFCVFPVRCPRPLSSRSPVWPLKALCCLCAVLGHLAPVHQCARSVWCVACAVSWPTWRLFINLHIPGVVSRVWCPRPCGSRSPLC